MKRVGQILRQNRRERNLSLSELADITKIKVSLLKKLEEGRWDELPAYPVVRGFVRNIAGVLELDEKQVEAQLRRDYPPRALSINPKADIEEKFRWSPKLTFISGILVAAVAIAGYLLYQYFVFTRPPTLEIASPKEGEVVTSTPLKVFGKTDSDAVVKINNQPIVVGSDGTFEAELEVTAKTKEIEARATSRSGKETVVRRTIEVKL